jgi:nucleoside-diphosphate-sugar epimerase
MRILVTGASGYIGSAVVPELLNAGHTVVGLARSDNSAGVLAAVGAEVQRGDLDDLENLRRAAAAADGVIHLAFMHDRVFSGDMQGAADADRRAVEIFGEVLAGSNRPLVIASGLGGLRPGRVMTELDGHTVDIPAAAHAGVLGGLQTRLASAELVLSFAARGVRSSIVRISPTCHGSRDRHGFIPRLIAIARSTGVSGYPGDGSSCWPAVHLLDTARLFRLALENAPAGSTLHAVAEQGVALSEIAHAIGRQLGLPAARISNEDTGKHFGPMTPFMAIDGRASSTLTQELLSWKPAGPGLIEDLEQGHYFDIPQTAAA